MDVGVGFVENILLRHVGVIETPALSKCSKQKQHSECTAKQQIAKKIKWKTVMITRFKKIRLIFPIEWRCYDLLSNYGWDMRLFFILFYFRIKQLNEILL